MSSDTPDSTTNLCPLSLKDLERWGRQLILPRWDARFQAELANLTVHLVGVDESCGIYLRCAGVGQVIAHEDSASVIASGWEGQALITASGPPTHWRGVAFRETVLSTFGYSEPARSVLLPHSLRPLQPLVAGAAAAHLLLVAERERFPNT